MELYEELPDGQIQEELYEDLPAGPYDGYPNSSPSHSQSPTEPVSPPPLPTSRPPSSRPPGSQPSPSVPPIPQRAPSTSLSTASTLPPARRKGKPDAPKKSSTLRPTSSSGGGGGGGGGIDMNEIVKKARMRDISAFENLESKRNKDEEGEKHVAPWLNQLRKPGVLPPGPKLRSEEDKADVPPWVKRKAAVEKTVPHGGTENGEEEVPEFIRRARKMSFHEDQPTSPPPTHKPPPPLAAKPRSIPPPVTHPKPPVQEPQTAEKPPWLKQRERQANLSKLSRDSSENEPPRPSIPPKPKPTLPNGRQESPNHRPPTPTRKPRPLPARVAPKPPTEARREEEGSKVNEKDDSPPLTPNSIRERAKTLERNMGISGRTTPPSLSPKVPARPKPLPRSISKKSMTPEEQTPPPVPIRKETTELTFPHIPARDTTVPTTVSSAPPPVVPPRNTPSITTAPPAPLTKPPLSKPPLRLPASHGEPTPPMDSVQKFRRRPLEIVDLNNPPPVPARHAKPCSPAGTNLPEDEPEIDDIYDDTVTVLQATNSQEPEEEEEEFYDDVTSATQKPLPPETPPPPSRPPPPSSPKLGFIAPPLPSHPPPPSSPKPGFTAPPLPSQPPPSKRPPPPPIVTEDETNYEVEDAPPNGITPISPIDQEQEVYEDMNPEDVSPYASQAPSSSSLVPPSPHTSPRESPTLSRKQKNKDDRRQQKEDEKREKEREKERKKQEKERERLEKEKEKEKKRKEEAYLKNRQKGLKTYKQFSLPNDVQSLFAVEILLDHPRAKDHLCVTEGEIAFVLLISHPKLPEGRYLAEKEDGTIGYLKKDITQRTAYQSGKGDGPPAQSYPDPEDIYESLPDGAPQEDISPSPPTTHLPPSHPPPSHPPPNHPPPSHPPPSHPPPSHPPPTPTGHLPATGTMRFPPPSQPPPPPPPEATPHGHTPFLKRGKESGDDDEPEENYEYLPDQ